MGRSKLAYWNLIYGYEQTPVTFAEQPADDMGFIPGSLVYVSNPGCQSVTVYNVANSGDNVVHLGDNVNL